jgi:hypothetical protein
MVKSNFSIFGAGLAFVPIFCDQRDGCGVAAFAFLQISRAATAKFARVIDGNGVGTVIAYDVIYTIVEKFNSTTLGKLNGFFKHDLAVAFSIAVSNAALTIAPAALILPLLRLRGLLLLLLRRWLRFGLGRGLRVFISV